MYFGFLNNFEMDLRYYGFDTFDHPIIFQDIQLELQIRLSGKQSYY